MKIVHLFTRQLLRMCAIHEVLVYYAILPVYLYSHHENVLTILHIMQAILNVITIAVHVAIKGCC